MLPPMCRATLCTLRRITVLQTKQIRQRASTIKQHVNVLSAGDPAESLHTHKAEPISFGVDRSVAAL